MYKQQRGFTLTELMVSMVLGLFLSLGITAIFFGQQRTTELAQTTSEAQENARIALELLASDIAQVGFLGDFDHRLLIDPESTSFHPPFPVVAAANDCVGAGTNNASFPVLGGGKFRMLFAEHKTTSPLPSLAQCATTSPVSNSDVIQLKRFIAAPGTSRVDLAGPPGATAVINVNERSNRFYGYSNMNSLVFYSGNAASPTWDTAANGRVFQYQHHAYWIGNSTINGEPVPSLYRRHLMIDDSTGQPKMSATSSGPLVSGVERVAFEFGLDVDQDNSPDRYVATADMTNIDWEGITGDIATVRIQVLGRSITEDDGYQDNKTYEMASGTFGPYNDGFHRQLVSTIVTVRSLR